MSSKTWVPLEANTEVISDYLQKLGVQGVAVSDVYGFDDELLSMVPPGVIAVLLVYPITPENEAARRAQAELCHIDPATCFFMKQTVGNACGSVAIVHAVANNAQLSLTESSILRKFLTAARDGTPEQRALLFEHDEGIDSAQAVAANEGATERPPSDADVNLHFICHVLVEGHAVELDGRLAAPVDLGECSAEGLLKRSAVRAQELIALNPAEMNWTALALCLA